MPRGVSGPRGQPSPDPGPATDQRGKRQKHELQRGVAPERVAQAAGGQAASLKKRHLCPPRGGRATGQHPVEIAMKTLVIAGRDRIARRADIAVMNQQMFAAEMVPAGADFASIEAQN